MTMSAADFVARFFSFRDMREQEPNPKQEEQTYTMISQALNEFVENAAKYSRERCCLVEMEMQYYNKAALGGEDRRILRIDVMNEADPASSDKLVEWSAEIFQADDLEKLYFQHLEARAEGRYEGSLLGLITLLKDYPLKMGFKVLESADSVRKVISRAYFILD